MSTLQEALSATPITTAGLDSAPAADPRKSAIKVIRTALRKPDATDDEVDSALEALIELAKD